MTVIIQDTARNTLVSWARECVNQELAEDVIVSPFTSPVHKNNYKASIGGVAAQLHEAGCEVWLDPMTHALQIPNVGDFRYYTEWDLWPSTIGDLSSPQARRGHIDKVFKAQDDLGAQNLAPTVLLPSPQTPASTTALDLAKQSLDANPECWLSVAGDIHFWTSGSDLDAHIGTLAQLETSGWMLTTVRSGSSLPVQATAQEIFGLLRTVRSLSAISPVYVQFGDMAALPALAAGAKMVGTGWDARQRVCSYKDYQPRSQDAEGGQWYGRPTLEGLLGSLLPKEYERLRRGDDELANQLTPGVLAPGPKEAFMHHATVLSRITQTFEDLPYRARYDALAKMYQRATRNWARLTPRFPTETTARHWINPFKEGLSLYGTEEGWPT